MYLSLNWLKEFVDVKMNAKEFAEKLTMSGTKVESVREDLGDVLLELEITPNRADLYSVFGMAREVSALLREPLKMSLDEYNVTQEQFSSDNILRVQIEGENFCPKYIARVISAVKVEESPDWLKMRLTKLGIRPVNNIVDITNYVMLELGQPLHSFDRAKVGEKIIVRQGKRGEEITTLDGKTRQLDTSILVIANEDKPIAIAGVMGGIESEVTQNSRDIILEAAVFDPVAVRKSARKLGLMTDAVSHFERAVDSNITEIAIDRAALLVSKIAGGKLKDKIIVSEEKRLAPINIEVEFDYIENLIGKKIEKKEIESILRALNFEMKIQDEKIIASPPLWRKDVNIKADVVEEIARMYGYDKLKPSFVAGEIKPPKENQSYVFEEKIRDILASLGFDEVYHYSFYGEKNLIKEEHIIVVNPINPNQTYLKRTHLSTLLENVSFNLRYFDDVKIFEIGKIYWPKNHEKKVLAGALSLKKKPVSELYRELKGVLELLLGDTAVDYKKSGDRVNIFYKDDKIGEIHLVKDRENYKIRQSVIAFEISLESLIKIADAKKRFIPIPVYPAIVRDINFVFFENHKYSAIRDEIAKVDPLIKNIELLDEYYLSSGERSLTFRITYRSDERTLKSREIDEIEDQILQKLNSKFDARIRR